MMAAGNMLRSLCLASLVLTVANSATLTVSTTGGNASSPILYGLMFEDINNSGDGGLHGQLLKNNGFQGNEPGLAAYAAVGGTTISQDTETPLTTAIKSTLNVAVPAGTTDFVGFSNSGYLGIPVNVDTYANYFWVQGDYDGLVRLQLVGNSSGTVYASKDITVTSNSDNFTYYETTYESKQSPDGDNVWQLLFDGSKVAGKSLNFGLVQLFPVTYHERFNGIRNDVGNFLEDIGGSFLRFPGGNNLEGSSPSTRWKWNETIGKVEDRPGRQGDWGYPNTDALGLMEYLQWCDDMKLIPILGVWAGLSLEDGGVLNGTDLEPYVQDTLDELEFLLGPTSSKFGALRATLGHPEPYKIEHVEVGNEDFLNGGCESYPSRFTDFYNAINKAYPSIIIIASTDDGKCLPDPLPAGAWTDIHHYLTPQDLVARFDEFDNYARGPGSGIFVGEYSSKKTESGANSDFPSVQTAVGEAVYMIGMERNSDFVKMAAYAPLFEHFELAQWQPNLIGLDTRPNSLTGSVSYYVQLLFFKARGSTILPVESDANFGPLYWVASSTDSGTYYLKIANYGTDSQNVTVKIPTAGDVKPSAGLQILTGKADATNLPLNVTVKPVASEVTGSKGDGWEFALPGYGLAILTISAA